ncbi:ion transporter [Pelobacter propionicus]|uniref:Ion transport protein n=1 Tax=Pelobacter propionicus (strain DSM 2379 / NBRC 103807 / OttBd1) TaxID=338966 RepID=A1ATZ8_PELPD|nr:ion transporter [Pelobacter propionicus]ABL00819.1 Ion transport protein [Pelobacter propionicus DSM 2379]
MTDKFSGIREQLYVIIFEADTRVGRAFDLTLIVFILLSVLLVMLDSIPELHQQWGSWFWGGELLITVLFSIEYLLRLYCARRPARYALSFYGMVDLLAIIPGYASLFLPGLHLLSTVRILRVLRIFRVLKMVQFMGEGSNLWLALKRSRYKITVFLTTVVTIVVFVGSLMYLIEGSEGGFTSIPKSIYWAIVTMTTVGYGDIAPRTSLGQMVASLLMVIGYGIIAVPTGIVTTEMMRPPPVGGVCPCCGRKVDRAEER